MGIDMVKVFLVIAIVIQLVTAVISQDTVRALAELSAFLVTAVFALYQREQLRLADNPKQ